MDPTAHTDTRSRLIHVAGVLSRVADKMLLARKWHGVARAFFSSQIAFLFALGSLSGRVGNNRWAPSNSLRHFLIADHPDHVVIRARSFRPLKAARR